MTECDQTDARLAARSEGALSATDAAALAAHLEVCDDCRLLAEGLDDGSAAAPVFPVVDASAYELGPVVGHGGMGRIRIARDRRIGRRVAMKELLFNTESLAARFVREARVAASLQHPNIVPIYEVGCWADGTPFYTMRMIEGRTLFKAIQDATSLEERMELLPSVIAAADAVAFAHANGIIHRDLTPANILLGDFGETIVIDWGLAKDLRVDLDRVAPEYQTGMTQQVLTAKGDVVGSPAYMPREQAAGEEIDARADVYALGAILYHLLAGRAPYQGRSSKAIIQKVRAEAPTPLDKVALGAPRGLVAIVRKAMARDVGDRHSNAKELASELRRFQAALVVGAHRGPLTRWLG